MVTRWFLSVKRGSLGSLLLGLYDDAGILHPVGVTSSFAMKRRSELLKALRPLRRNAMHGHPWREWVDAEAAATRMPGAPSRRSTGRDLSWEPLRIERTCEVKYDHMQGNRFRHAAQFLRYPISRPPKCR